MNGQAYILDLKDEAVASEYDVWHRPGCVPPKVIADMLAIRIDRLKIDRFSNCLEMTSYERPAVFGVDRVSSDASRACAIQRASRTFNSKNI